MSRYPRLSLMLCLAVWAAGCGEDVPEEVVPPLQPVSGTVKLDGEPAAGVSVNFVPAGQGSTNGAIGATDASGKYSLTYRTGDPGIPAGEYNVLFTKFVQPDGTPIPAGQMAADVMAVNALPEQYQKPGTTKAIVPEGGNTFDFDLKSK